MLLTPTFFHYIYGLCFAFFFGADFHFQMQIESTTQASSVLDHIYMCTRTMIMSAECALIYEHICSTWQGALHFHSGTQSFSRPPAYMFAQYPFDSCGFF